MTWSFFFSFLPPTQLFCKLKNKIDSLFSSFYLFFFFFSDLRSNFFGKNIRKPSYQKKGLPFLLRTCLNQRNEENGHRNYFMSHFDQFPWKLRSWLGLELSGFAYRRAADCATKPGAGWLYIVWEKTCIYVTSTVFYQFRINLLPDKWTIY